MPGVLDVPVLIAGGGPVGLTASILLSRLGVPSLLVERHPGTSIHPKARGINIRTMEIFRQCGIEDAVRAAGLDPERARFIIWTRTLAGEELERRVPGRARPGSAPLSPARHCTCAQDDLEPVLRRFAESSGLGTVEFSTELIGFEQDGDAVTATLRRAGADTRVRARYLIAADGARSRVREALGIPMQGTPALYRSVNVLLLAELTPWVADRPAALYFVEQPGLRATFLTINGANRWGFLINLPLNASVEEYTAARCADVVRQAAGLPDLDVEILGVDPWVAAAQVATRYRDGRVFLAGDAAHHMPPTGGFGLNTGVQDVHNLAWKLAAVLQGWATPALLDSYEAERLPHGRAITEQSLANAISMGRGPSPNGSEEDGARLRARPEFLNELGMVFGARYDSTAIIQDGTPPPEVANAITDYVPVARPGSRAPHVWLERDGTAVSTLDLVRSGFTLLAGPEGASWCVAAHAVASSHGIPLDAFTIGAGSAACGADVRGGDVREADLRPADARDVDVHDPENTWLAAYGITTTGAVLIRPDMHVAWRAKSSTANPVEEIGRVFSRILGHTAAPSTIAGVPELLARAEKQLPGCRLPGSTCVR
jgi:2-polyprenyl-6-methoxyphenol hydroxylase-like FAD-dependent oxidoreductase